MERNDIPSDDKISKWTERGLSQLYGFMSSFQPTFQTRESNDPILLAQEFQRTIDAESNEHFRKIMGTAGEETLNTIAPHQITFRHLAIITSRLIVLNEEDGELSVSDYSDTNTMVTGVFDRFAFEDAESLHHADRDWIAVKLIKPDFLFAQSRKVSMGFFDAEKDLIPVSSTSELTIPVDAVQGRLYDPETLFQ